MEAIPALRQEKMVESHPPQTFPKPKKEVLHANVKKKPRTAIKHPQQFVLSLRSFLERERMIAQQAAMILTPVPDDPLKPADPPFKNAEPCSDFVRRHCRPEEGSLWRLSASADTASGSQLFYIDSMRSVLTPARRKKDRSNVLFHLSQLPGRGSSQVGGCMENIDF